jgi:hypothetical protein
MMMFIVVPRGRWTCGSKIGLADVLEPDAFMSVHVSFAAGDDEGEEENED